MNAVSHPNQGVTLLEIIIATVITGIIAAIGAPSLMGMLQGDQVKQGVDQIQLALQDAQKQAIRNSKQCSVEIKKKTGKDYFSLDTTDASCLGGSDRELPNSIDVVMNGTSDTLANFSFKGNVASQGKTIVIKPTKGKGVKRCLVISSGLGIMRTGIYDSTVSDDNPPTATNCNKITEF